VHGEKGAAAALIAEQAAAAGLTSPRFAAHAPPLPIGYGTHHSKAFLLGYKHGGLRLIVHTANMIYPDCSNKTQGLWYQVGRRQLHLCLTKCLTRDAESLTT
jgi:tyrosyl-DNA phosphodiesterase-1